MTDPSTLDSSLVFPTSQFELNPLLTYASQHGHVIDPMLSRALAVEIKTSWVEAGNLSNLSSYITTIATIPTYDTQSDPKHWRLTGEKTATLALVGMHVVGSVNGHPEMIWATFEHFNNSPNSQYKYFQIDNLTPVTVSPSSSSGPWLFASSINPPFNLSRNLWNTVPNNLNGIDGTGASVLPDQIMRMRAWGADIDVKPNPLEGELSSGLNASTGAGIDPGATAAASNTEIISINNSILEQLPTGDIRKNYFMVGATWTTFGHSPTSTAFPDGGNQVGTSALANSTMETFQQGADNTSSGGGLNCFSCHMIRSNQGQPVATTGVSHIFPCLKPLN